MKGKILKIVLATIMVMAIISCSPSEEAIATMTASAWTPIPLPTATPTPIPYSLTVKVIDEYSEPIPLANIMFVEVGEELMAVDENGMVSFQNLPGEQITLAVSAPGFFSADISGTIQRGENNIEVMLKHDSGAYMPADACRPDEILLYIEDFQDGKAQNWDQIMASVENNAPGWSIQPAADDPKNQILIASNNISFSNSSYSWDKKDFKPFTNAVWRIKVKFENTNLDMFLNWLHWSEGEHEWRFIIQFGGFTKLSLGRFELPKPGHFGVGDWGWLQEGQWYDFEISTFNGTTEVWVDGYKKISYTDPKPFEKGTIGIEVHLFEGSTSVYYFDNIAVCGLSKPFESIISPESY